MATFTSKFNPGYSKMIVRKKGNSLFMELFVRYLCSTSVQILSIGRMISVMFANLAIIKCPAEKQRWNPKFVVQFQETCTS